MEIDLVLINRHRKEIIKIIERKYAYSVDKDLCFFVVVLLLQQLFL